MRWFFLLLIGSIVSKANAVSIVPAPANPPIQISAALDKSSFSADESVDVTVTASNPTTNTVFLGASAYELSTFRFTLKDEEGRDIKLTSFGEKALSRPEAVFSNTGLTLPPGQKRYVVFPLRQMFDVAQGGTFTLVASRGIPSPAVEIAPKQYQHDWYTLAAKPIRFSVAPSEAYRDLPFTNTLLAGTRLERYTYQNEKPVWLDWVSIGGDLPRLTIRHLDQYKWHDAGEVTPAIWRAGDSLLARIKASNRSTQLNLARVFDLSQPGNYILEVQGESRKFRFQVIGIVSGLHSPGFRLSVSREDRLANRVGLLQPFALDAQDNAIQAPEIF